MSNKRKIETKSSKDTIVIFEYERNDKQNTNKKKLLGQIKTSSNIHAIQGFFDGQTPPGKKRKSLCP